MLDSIVSMLPAPAEGMGHSSGRLHVSGLVKARPPRGDQEHRCLNDHVAPGLGRGRGSTTPATIQGDDVKYRPHAGQFEGMPIGDIHARAQAIKQLSRLDAPRTLAQPLLTGP
jgi:hypothetical protein